MPLRAVVAVPSLQLSTSWVDFGTCFVSQKHSREISLMNLSDCLSYWTVLMGMSLTCCCCSLAGPSKTPAEDGRVLSLALGPVAPESTSHPVPGCPALVAGRTRGGS